jgi:HK97 family phage major capsid protein
VPKEKAALGVGWHTEGDAITETSAVFESSDLATRRLDAYVDVSNELLNDSSAGVAAILFTQFSEKVAQKVDSTVFNTDGSEGVPVSGIFVNTSVASAVIGSASFQGIKAEDLITLMHKVPKRYRTEMERSMFIMHPDVMQYLRKETDGQSAYLWGPYSMSPSGGVPRVQGYRILESDEAPSTDGTGNPIAIFANWRWWLVGNRPPLQLLTDPYSRSTYYETRFVMVRRLALANAEPSAFARLVNG